MALFESYERRIDKINSVLNSYGIASIEEAEKITKDAGLDVYNQVKGIQPICFENACWAYITGAAIAIKKGCRKASDAAAAIGEGLQAFCIPGSVADQRKVGLGHGNLGKMLLEEDTDCFCFLAGHESFAAAEGAIGIAEKANKVRKKPLRVILNGLGKDAAQIIARINGFTYVETLRLLHRRVKGSIQKSILRRPPCKGKLLRRKRCPRGRCYHVEGERRRFHHRKLHKPDTFPAPGSRYLQEGAR